MNTLSERHMPRGWGSAINAALAGTTMVPGGDEFLSFLHGHRKCLVVQWRGDLRSQGEDFNTLRGDGDYELLDAGHPGLMIPPNLAERPEDEWNIRASVPLWLIHPNDGRPLVLACGALHPWYSAATVDHYDPGSGQWRNRSYISDPRIDPRQAPADWPDIEEQRWQLREANGMLKTHASAMRPVVRRETVPQQWLMS